MSILSGKVAQLADHQQEVSMREFLTKIYIRPKLFWSCVLIPAILGLLFTALIPTTWKASVKIMLRYSSSESVFLRDLIPENRALLSGASSAEILRSIPTLVNTIREQDIRDEDIYKKPHEVLGGHVSSYLEDFFPSSLPPGLPGIDPKTLLLANAFKESLQESSSGGSKRKPVEVLEKSSQLPSTMKGDELIVVEVRSFNREKVAQMANGLASAFIDEYYRVSEDDAHRAYEFLSQLVEKGERDLRAAEMIRDVNDSTALAIVAEAGREDIARSSPLLESMSEQLVKLQTAYAEAEQVYPSDAEPVVKLRNQIARASRDLARQERIEIAKQSLEQLKVRRYQALNTENLYKNRLVPISIVEPAFTPKKSFSKVAVRYLIGGGVGLALGLMLGLSLIVVLDVTDPRLHTSWQIEKRIGLPILASLPDQGKLAANPLEGAAASNLGMITGLLQILGKMGGAFAGGEEKKKTGARVVVLASPSRGEGRTFLTLALGGALGAGGRHRVLLVDASLHNAGLSKLLELSGKPGYVDAMLSAEGMEPHIVKNAYRGCDVLPAGNLERLGELGFYSEALAQNIGKLRELYDFVIIDTAPALSSNEALICGLSADSTLIAIWPGQTRKALVRAAIARMRDVGVKPEAVVLTRTRQILPAFIYRSV